jgi:hypothetical protein
MLSLSSSASLGADPESHVGKNRVQLSARCASAPQSEHDAPLLRIGSIGPGMSVEYYLRATSREGPNPHNLLELVKAPRMQAPLAGVGGLD